MGKIIKENGIIWFEELQTLDGKHKKMTMLGTYDENEEVKKEKRATNVALLFLYCKYTKKNWISQIC